MADEHALSEAWTETAGERIANTVSHGVGALLAIAATPFLIVAATRLGDGAFVAGVSVFCASAVFLYLASTIYHGLPDGRAREFFLLLDHAGIFLLIAGTYTPFTLGVLSGTLGWALFGAVWSIAVVGVLLKLFARRMPDAVSTALYLALGWIVLVAIGPVVARVSATGLAWLVAGGLFYSGGVVFFHLDRKLRYGHFVWHLFVVAGTVCHGFAVLGHAA